MKGRIIKDWRKVNFQSQKSQALLMGALTVFMRQPSKDPLVKKAAQHFATKGDFPAEILQILDKIIQLEAYDTAFEDVFDIRDFTNTQESGFDLLDVQSGLTFAKVKTGTKIKVFKMSGAKTSVTFDMYGGGLGWDRKLIDDAQYWTLEDNAITFRNEAYRSRAAVYYALIEALAVTYDTAWQNPEPAALANTDPTYVANRDAQTINTACQTIITNCKDLGLGVTPNTTFILLAPYQLKGRIARAMALMLQGYQGSAGQLYYNISPRYTTMFSSASDYYVCAPKGKAKAGYRMDLTLFSAFDNLSYSDVVAGWMRYGGAIGEIKQFSRCKTS